MQYGYLLELPQENDFDWCPQLLPLCQNNKLATAADRRLISPQVPNTTTAEDILNYTYKALHLNRQLI